MGASWLHPVAPTVAIEITSRRVTVVAVTGRGSDVAVRALATESLPEGAVTPALTGDNVPGVEAVIAALSRALQRSGLAGTKRAALVVPDSIARLSLVSLASVPSRPAELDQVMRWQLRKSAPFPLEQAQVSYFEASRSTAVTTMAAVVARRSVVTEYERVAQALGIQVGAVDLASLNVMNVVMAMADAAAGDALVIHLSPEATTLAILRDAGLMFYRHRATMDGEPLRALVHQTAMYHEDRLDGGTFARVWMSGDGACAEAAAEIKARLGLAVEPVDVRLAAPWFDGAAGTAEAVDAAAAPVGILLRDRKAA